MHTLVIFALGGLIAQMVDGTLGMGYGVTATTVLLAAGAAPATASASVHVAKVGTGLASGVAHWKFGNVDWPVVGRIAGPGAVGAAAGAVLLSSLAAGSAAVWVAGLLVILGGYVLLRFSVRAVAANMSRPGRPGSRFLAPLGLVAGFIDAIGGGGWGPVATSSLLASGRLEPRKVVGSVVTAEFAVAVAATVAFLVALSSGQLSVFTVLGLLVGGVVAAPFAAWLVRATPPRLLGTAAGGMIVLTNVHTVLAAAVGSVVVTAVVYAVLVPAWAGALLVTVRDLRAERAAPAAHDSDGADGAGDAGDAGDAAGAVASPACSADPAEGEGR